MAGLTTSRLLFGVTSTNALRLISDPVPTVVIKMFMLESGFEGIKTNPALPEHR